MTTIRNLLLVITLLLPMYASADDDSFIAALWEQSVSTMMSDAGLLIVFGEHDFGEICTLAKSHSANVKLIVSSLISDHGSEAKQLTCN